MMRGMKAFIGAFLCFWVALSASAQSDLERAREERAQELERIGEARKALERAKRSESGLMGEIARLDRDIDSERESARAAERSIQEAQRRIAAVEKETSALEARQEKQAARAAERVRAKYKLSYGAGASPFATTSPAASSPDTAACSASS